MEKLKEIFSKKVFRVLKWIFLILIGLFFILIVFRTFNYVNVQKTESQVIKIHNTKLSMDDVMGKSLPADPGIEADKTIQGIDANNNGIRDDVELAIFKEYPDSAKTRVVLLQYALALQMETVQPFVNEEVATEVVTEQGRADTCLSDTISPRKTSESERNDAEINKIDILISFLNKKQLNTDIRNEAHNNFYKYLRSYGESSNIECDIDLSQLQN